MFVGLNAEKSWLTCLDESLKWERQTKVIVQKPIDLPWKLSQTR